VNERESAAAAAPVPPVFEPPPGNPRFPLFDGLRAVAALGVLLGHCSAAAGAATTTLAGHAVSDLQMGVAVFFVISGFLLYRPFVAADMSGTRPSPTAVFYRRRLLRIVPGYWFALTLIALLPGVVGVFGEGWWRYYLLLQNYSGVQAVFARGIGPAWSLSVELAFYLLLPLFAFAMRKTAGNDAGRRVVRDLIVLAVLALASAVARAHLVAEIQAAGGLVSQFTWTLILTLPLFLTWFAFGMAFASVSAWSRHTGNTPNAVRAAAARPGLVWLFAGACFALLVAALPSSAEGETPARYGLTALIAAALVFPAAFPHPEGRGLPGRLLSIRAVAWVGLISYGIYLWTSPLISMFVHEGILGNGVPFLALTGATLAAAIAAGAFSYYVVERPFLRLKTRRRRAPDAPGPATLASRESRV
jgi:peptidoglycan/LPS O-acetylase OafA/YrhL